MIAGDWPCRKSLTAVAFFWKETIARSNQSSRSNAGIFQISGISPVFSKFAGPSQGLRVERCKLRASVSPIPLIPLIPINPSILQSTNPPPSEPATTTTQLELFR